MNELFEAKRNLYSLLLRKPHTALTEYEINIMYELSRDTEIQAHISKWLNEVHSQ